MSPLFRNLSGDLWRPCNKQSAGSSSFHSDFDWFRGDTHGINTLLASFWLLYLWNKIHYGREYLVEILKLHLPILTMIVNQTTFKDLNEKKVVPCTFTCVAHAKTTRTMMEDKELS
jgi:hypothetical protein